MTVHQPYIAQQFNGDIWRMEIDEITDTIFIEIRNEAEKQVSFSSIDLNTGNLNFKDLVTSERWLTGIETAFDGVLLLHNYQSASGPTHRGITAIDTDATVLWTNYNQAFDHLTIKGPILYDTQIQPKKIYLADVKTGAVTRLYEPTVLPGIKSNITVPGMVLPETLPHDLLTFSVFGNSVHYLEYNNFRIVSLHTLQAGVLKQYLYVMDGSVKVYEDLLNTDIQKLQPEAFILHKNRLIYIKNKTELKVLSL
ncbi:DUF4905 domain-containing protein [Mucilaginibacter sp.]